FQAEDGIRDRNVTGVQTCALPISKAQQVARFLTDMLSGVGPEVARGRDTVLLRQILDQTAKRIEGELTNQPEVEFQLRRTVGNRSEERRVGKECGSRWGGEQAEER